MARRTEQDASAAPRSCRCEAAIPPQIMDGFACGAADCWRTAEAAASFSAFVAELKRRRAADPGTAEPPVG